MIGAVALLLIVQEVGMKVPPTDPVVESAVSEQIVVIGKQLEGWRGKIKTRRGEATCKTTKSTKDLEIDKIGCGAMLGCMLEVKPQMDAIAALDLPRDERQRRYNEKAQEIGPCMVEQRDAAIDLLARQRADAQ